MVPSAPASPPKSTRLQAMQLLSACPTLSAASQLCVAFSGGLDSTVLLHLLVALRDAGQLNASLRALHINHGLQTAADAWAQRCAKICEQWQVPFTVINVQVLLDQRESPEAAARSARYAAFEENLQSGELLMQAHHQDDQAETVMLRLLRGSGARGLGGIPAERALGRGTLLRPLLRVSRADLQDYAGSLGLQWIEDPSNCDARYDRNYLRNIVMPALVDRWPEANASLARSAQLGQEAADLLDELALVDWQQARLDFPNRLKLSAVQKLSPARARNLLGYWLGHQPAVLDPGNVAAYALLQRCMDELVLPRDQEYRVLAWGEGSEARCLHRYRDILYLLKPLSSPPATMSWSLTEPLLLPEALGSLSWQEGDYPSSPEMLTVKFRQGGETFTMTSGQHKPLKNLLQERGIPPWLRDHIPLLYQGEVLLAVGDVLLPGITLGSATKKHNPLCWKRSELLCGY